MTNLTTTDYQAVELDPNARVLLVSPHPDDECLSFGGTLSEHMRRGGSAGLIAVTDGEAADDEGDARSRSLLVTTRSSERARALAHLGLSQLEIVRLCLPDGDVASKVDDLTTKLRKLFEHAVFDQRRPLTVVAPWRLDMHPDHEACARATRGALAGLSVRLLEVPIWSWFHFGWNVERSAGSGVSRGRHAIPIAPATQEAKRRALREFSSQVDLLPNGRGPVLPNGFLESFDRAFEPVIL